MCGVCDGAVDCINGDDELVNVNAAFTIFTSIRTCQYWNVEV